MTNETLSTLKERRSIRKFKSEQITREELDAVLEAGMYAPTGRNRQSPLMIVVQDSDMREKISKINAKIMGQPGVDPFYGAPAVLVVLSRKEAHTYVYDGSLTLGNMMLAAHALGLGSCWIHRARETFENPKWKSWLKEIGIDGDLEGIGNLVVGYPTEQVPDPKPIKPNRVFYVK